MLSHLYIKNFAIIPSLALDFHQGFTAITGETGAGKSILVDALGLLLGARSDSQWVREGCASAELTAEFMLEANPDASDWLTASGLDSDGQCLLRRAIAANGRSRAWINGTPVTLQQLGELGGLLVEIHGQNEHMRLKLPAQQFKLLDASGGYDAKLQSVSTAYREWKTLQDEFHALEQQAGLSPAELDYLKFQLSELESHAISSAEVQALEQEHRKLAQGGALVEALDFSSNALEDDDHGSHQLIHSVIARLEPYRALDPSIEEALRMLSEAAINCQEAAQGIRQASEHIDLSPERLAAVAGQLNLLGDLGRKHQVPMEALASVRDKISDRLSQTENFESQRDEMEAACGAALEKYRATAFELSASRASHARQFSRAISALMADLGMAGGLLEIRIRHDAGMRPSARGDDEISLMVSVNRGVSPGPISKVASGGELSRISLAIKVAASRKRSVRTQIFDEVDAGIGGETANAVGRLMQTLAASAQALCVTHLAQVAVCAHQQLQVRKEAAKDHTAVDTALLESTERVDEIARMLGGRVSEQSRRHASEMLIAAGNS
jgi:DNA repair protein RecN (Recombination protein N)